MARCPSRGAATAASTRARRVTEASSPRPALCRCFRISLGRAFNEQNVLRFLIADEDNSDDTKYGFSVKYDVGAATEIRFAFADTGIDNEDEVYGIGFRHSLGGGVSLRGGIGQNTPGNTVADLGVIFNF